MIPHPTLAGLRAVATLLKEMGLSRCTELTLGVDDYTALQAIRLMPGASFHTNVYEDVGNAIDVAEVDVNGFRFNAQHSRAATEDELSGKISRRRSDPEPDRSARVSNDEIPF